MRVKLLMPSIGKLRIGLASSLGPASEKYNPTGALARCMPGVSYDSGNGDALTIDSAPSNTVPIWASRFPSL